MSDEKYTGARMIRFGLFLIRLVIACFFLALGLAVSSMEMYPWP